MKALRIDKNGHIEFVSGAEKTPVAGGKDTEKNVLKVIVRYIDDDNQSSEVGGFVKSTTSTAHVRNNISRSL